MTQHISSTSAMWFFLIMMTAFMVASYLNGETPQLSAFSHGIILSGLIAMFFCGASDMAKKNRDQINNQKSEG